MTKQVSKCLVLFNDGETMTWFVAQNFEKFHGIYINAFYEEKENKTLEKKLTALVYDEEGAHKHNHHPMHRPLTIQELITMGITSVVFCGFIP